MTKLRILALVASAALAACAVDATDDDDSEVSSEDALTTADPAYAIGQPHSTLTPAIVAHLKTILAGGTGDPQRFIKVGDSITVSTSFLDCLGTKTVAQPLEATRVMFDEGTGHVAGESSWNRRTLSAVVGWHTTQPLAGSPSPLDREIAAMHPSFAFVMLGTNDNDASQTNGCGGSTGTCIYRKNLEHVVDALIAKHVVPIISTIPPRGNSATADARVPLMNSIVRFVAAERQIPLMDFHMSIKNLPSKGLGGDGIHPNVASTGACDFTAAGLEHGYNVRTHLALEALDRVQRALDAPPPAVVPDAGADASDADGG